MTMTAPAATTCVFRRRGDLEFLTWPVFDPLPVDVAVSTRHGGTSAGAYASLNLSFDVGDDPAAVLANRRRVAAALGAGLGSFVFARQVHGAAAAIVSAADRGRGAYAAGDAVPGVDALVTADPGTVLAVLAADCVPIVLYDPAARVLACVHAGWRGTVARAAAAALDAMRTLGARPANVIAGVGPAIGPADFQVGPEVAAAVERAFGASARDLLWPDPGGRWRLDLWAASRLTLREAGVPAAQIHVAAVPTGPRPGRFFSHRAERPCGRFALLARLEPGGER
jgi:YfiH family protein